MARIIGKGYSYDDVLIVPKYNQVKSRKDVSFRTRVTRNYFIDIPFIAANMDTVCESKMAITIGKMGGLGVIHRFLKVEEQAEEVKKVKQQNLLCAAAVGVKDYETRVPALVKAGANILVLDVAHGHSKQMGKVLAWVKYNHPKVDVMVGNIASKGAADYFVAQGADAIKVGVGPGSLCTTRIMTGAGVPQISAIMDAYEATQGRIPLCADGGIKVPGDVTKAIGAGADTVMFGSIIAGTDETPGQFIEQNGKKYKKYMGMASYEATIKKINLDGKQDEVISVEGETTIVEGKGPVDKVIKKFLGGLASGMTYVGARNIEQIRGKADFIEITASGLKESMPHLLLDGKHQESLKKFI